MMPSGSADAAPVAPREPAFDLTFVFGNRLSKAPSFDRQLNRSNDLTKPVCKIGADKMLATLDQRKNRGRENTVKYFDVSLRGGNGAAIARLSPPATQQLLANGIRSLQPHDFAFRARISKRAEHLLLLMDSGTQKIAVSKCREQNTSAGRTC
ncbi:hypothetical protein [Mesorhizobium sp. M0643]|uniref:hypothetical protein n=1 Tax=Mesorhizobium sp. M0643 TaxID=2956978 RepID=UPI003339B3D4